MKRGENSEKIYELFSALEEKVGDHDVVGALFSFIKEKFYGISWALSPVAFLLICGWYSRLKRSTSPEFKIIADSLQDFDENSLFYYASEAMDIPPSHTAMVAGRMVGIFSESAGLASRFPTNPGNQIEPLHLVFELLRYFVERPTNNERASLKELGLEIPSLVNCFLDLIKERESRLNPMAFEYMERLRSSSIGVSKDTDISDGERSQQNPGEPIAQQPASNPPKRPKLRELEFPELVSMYGFEAIVVRIFKSLQRLVIVSYGPGNLLKPATPRAIFYHAMYMMATGDIVSDDVMVLSKTIRLQKEDLFEIVTREFKEKELPSRLSTSVRFSVEMHEVADQAKQIALETSNSPNIALRHLLAAILTFRDSVEYLYFYRLKINRDEVLATFLRHLLVDHTKDSRNAWLSIFPDAIRTKIVGGETSSKAVGSKTHSSEDLPNADGISIAQFVNQFPTEKLIHDVIQWIDNRAKPKMPPKITPALFFYAAAGMANTSEGAIYLDCKQLNSILVADSLKIADAFISNSPAKADMSDRISIDMVNVTRSASQLAIETTGQKTIGLRHVLAAILFSRNSAESLGFDKNGIDGNRLIKDFKDDVLTRYSKDNQEAWNAEFTRLDASSREQGGKPEATPQTSEIALESEQDYVIGQKLQMNRDAGAEELSLGVEDYAKIVCEIFKKSDDGELCLAIFGPWGSGKTRLVKEIADRLQKDENAGYEIVQFSAWKYPSRPEVWVHLFQAFFERLRQPGLLHRFKTNAYVIRFGLLRHGVFPLIMAWLALVLTAAPKFGILEQAFKYFTHLEATVATAALVFVVTFGLRFWKTVGLLKKQYLTHSDHSDTLGLQATIGKDLKALLQSWVRVNNHSAETIWGFVFFAAAVVGLGSVIAWRAWAAPVVVICACAPLLVFAFFTGISFIASVPSPRRLLLVVDDLDRCQLNHLLSVVESIKLLLDDPEISKRVQVLMLMEEDVLKHAIWEKYKPLLFTRAKTELRTGHDSERLVRENCEKLFTAHLRLSSLRPEDVTEIVMRFGGEAQSSDRHEGEKPPEHVRAGPNGQPVPPNPSELTVSHTQESEAPLGIPKHKSDENPSNPVVSSSNQNEVVRTKDFNCSLSKGEKEEIARRIRAFYHNRTEKLSPRALRAFMFRYQLARMILEMIGNRNWNPSMLAAMIAHRMAKGESYSDRSAIENEVRRVVDRVA